MTPYTIRPATDGDCEGLWTVHVQAIRHTCSRAYSAEQIQAWSALLSPGSYVEMLRNRVVVVAEDDTGVIGFGQLDADRREIEAVYVRPDRQGQGIGRALLQRLESSARAVGIDKVSLSATLNAVPFYVRAGFTTEGPVVHRLPTGQELACTRMHKGL
ncbi:MAG: N-acetyltransferase family protein [Planctomycetota bacterium]